MGLPHHKEIQVGGRQGITTGCFREGDLEPQRYSFPKQGSLRTNVAVF